MENCGRRRNANDGEGKKGRKREREGGVWTKIIQDKRSAKNPSQNPSHHRHKKKPNEQFSIRNLFRIFHFSTLRVRLLTSCTHVPHEGQLLGKIVYPAVLCTSPLLFHFTLCALFSLVFVFCSLNLLKSVFFRLHCFSN